MTVRILQGDCRDVLKTLPDESVHCCVTSPPYFGLRDYGVSAQIGLEDSPDAFVDALVGVFREVRRVLRADGTAWINLGDSYMSRPNQRGLDDLVGTKQASNAGSRSAPSRSSPDIPAKNLIGIPWAVAFALRADGWWLRQDIIWSKPNPMPESVTDRCTKAHEYIFLLAKSERYYFDAEAMKEESVSGDLRRPYGSPGANALDPRGHQGKGIQRKTTSETRQRNKRSVWTVPTKAFSEAHFATFPPALIKPCILAGCPPLGTVLDPFGGAGTTGLVADRHGRHAILIELNPEYAAMAEKRITGDAPLFAETSMERTP